MATLLLGSLGKSGKDPNPLGNLSIKSVETTVKPWSIAMEGLEEESVDVLFNEFSRAKRVY